MIIQHIQGTVQIVSFSNGNLKLFYLIKNISTMINAFSASTFGHIYHKALQNQLKKIGGTLSLLRRARREEIDVVAAAINLRPETLRQIEDGKLDFRVKTLYALCDYYDMEIDTIVGQGELLHFKLT